MRLRVAPDDLAVALLAFASGTSDVLSFLALGGTFTSAMTGNTALLGLSLGQGRLAAAERAFAALIGFLCGGVAGTLCREHAGRQRALLRILALEAVCLGLFTAVWAGAADVENRWVLFPLILLSATGMGAQSVAARHINLPGLPTVVFTVFRRRGAPMRRVRSLSCRCAARRHRRNPQPRRRRPPAPSRSPDRPRRRIAQPWLKRKRSRSGYARN
jgi:hypothetical protein